MTVNEYHRDKISDIRIILGCMRTAELSKQDAARLIATACEIGVNYFDLAYVYGQGKAEEFFGEILPLTGVKREDIIIQSKTGTFIGRDYYAYDWSKENILETVDISLKRLNTDYIDVLLLHRPDALGRPEEVAEAFDILYEAGKVRHFGVSNLNPMQIELLNKYAKHKLEFNQMQLGLRHTGMIEAGLNVNTKYEAAVDRDGSILDYCRLKDIVMQAWSPFQYSDYKNEALGIYLGNDKFPVLNAKINELASAYSVSDVAIVTAWLLRHPADMQVVVGTTNVERLININKAKNITLSHKEWYELLYASRDLAK